MSDSDQSTISTEENGFPKSMWELYHHPNPGLRSNRFIHGIQPDKGKARSVTTHRISKFVRSRGIGPDRGKDIEMMRTTGLWLGQRSGSHLYSQGSQSDKGAHCSNIWPQFDRIGRSLQPETDRLEGGHAD